MRAAVFRGPNDIRFERVPIPDIGPGEALVRIACCGVCGTDIKKIQHGLVAPPRIFGHEMAGTIVALGAGTRGWSIGDRVAVMHHVPCRSCFYCDAGDFAQCPTYKRTGTTAGFEPAGGGFAEYVRVFDWVAAEGMVAVPEEVSFEEAAFLEPVNTCLKGLERARVRPGEVVLVIGQGQIGLLFTMMLRWKQARVVASDPLRYRREKALEMGAEAALDPAEDDVPAMLRGLTEGRGADLAIVAVADSSVVNSAMRTVRPGGRVLLFAQTRLGDAATVDAGEVCMLEKTLLGSYSSDITLQQAAADLVFSRTIDVRPLITHRFPLERTADAMCLASSPQDRSLKVMVQP